MTQAREAFATALAGVTGVLPVAPTTWSYSSLADAEACPRRWALSRASFPSIWDRPGFPERPNTAAIAGQVVHRCIEVIIDAWRAKGSVAASDPQAVQALRELGGYSGVLARQIDEVLSGFAGNPRAELVLDQVQRDLQRAVPKLRLQVQALVGRTPSLDQSASPSIGDSRGQPSQKALTPGVYTEMALHAPDLAFAGRPDFMRVSANACEISDFKSGRRQPQHEDQLRIYALLWKHDRERNPNDIPVSNLTISHPGGDVAVPVPEESDLRDLADSIRRRVENANREAEAHRPSARPSVENCMYCAVRPICDDYWGDLSTLSRGSDESPATYGDVEVVIRARNGPRSWKAAVRPQGADALLRTMSEELAWAPGTRLRLLDASVVEEESNGTIVVTLNAASEAFLLA